MDDQHFLPPVLFFNLYILQSINGYVNEPNRDRILKLSSKLSRLVNEIKI